MKKVYVDVIVNLKKSVILFLLLGLLCIREINKFNDFQSVHNQLYQVENRSEVSKNIIDYLYGMPYLYSHKNLLSLFVGIPNADYNLVEVYSYIDRENNTAVWNMNKKAFLSRGDFLAAVGNSAGHDNLTLIIDDDTAKVMGYLMQK